MKNFKPALVAVDKKGNVTALRLVEADGVLAIPADRYYQPLGWVEQHAIVVDGTNAKRWFATNMMDTTLGPFTQKQAALTALLEWNNLRSADLAETSSPLF